MRSKNTTLLMTLMTLGGLATPTLASDAETSATATRGYGRSGTATGMARYEGDLGFARTDTRTGRINAARSVALGVDRDGVSLSVSHAIAPQRGPALAANFNMSIGRNGTSHSSGHSVARGGLERSVTAGGATTSGTRYSRPVATSIAGGKTSFGGVVRAQTRSHSSPERRIVPVRRVILRR